MDNVNLKSKIIFLDTEFQLRTSTNGRMNRIISSLFKNGELINTREKDYTEIKDMKKLLALAKKFHYDRKNEIELFFNLSTKLEQDGSAELLNMLGLIFAQNNLDEEAVQEYLKAIKRKPVHSWIFNNLGISLSKLKKFVHAVQAFENAIKLNPDYADFYNNLGKVYIEMGACKNAIKQFDRAIKLNPYYAEAYFNKGLTYLLNQIRRDDFKLNINYREDALKCFEKAVLMNPSFQNQSYNEGLNDFKDENLVEAFEKLKAAKLDAGNFSYLHTKYQYFLKILFCRRDESYDTIWEYIKFLQDLIEKNPGHADLYNDLGLAYCMLRNYINEKAIESFQSALHVNPNFNQAKRNLKLSNYEKVGSELFLNAITFNERAKETKQLPESKGEVTNYN